MSGGRRSLWILAATAAGVLGMWLLSGDEPAGSPAGVVASTPFFPISPELVASPLGLARFGSAPDAAYRVRFDQGIRGVADVSDIFTDVATGRPLTGGDPSVRSALIDQVSALDEAGRTLWLEHAATFDAPEPSTPRPEGITAEATPRLLVPVIPEEDPFRQTVGPLLAAMTRVIETRTDVPVIPVQTRGGPWLQDFLVPFADGSIGIPPHLDMWSFQQTVAAAHEQAREVEVGGKALTTGAVVGAPLRDLRNRGIRFRQLRSLVEGGNVVFAQGRDSRVRAIVGRNTVQLTAATYGLTPDGALALLAEDFHLPEGDVVVIPQPDYHIDLYVRAGRPGQVFVASPQRGRELLEGLVMRGSGSPTEREDLEAQRQRASRSNASPVGQRVSRALESARDVLREAGFELIDYPSLYFSYFKTQEFTQTSGRVSVRPGASLYLHINTMNARYVVDTQGRVLNFVLATGYPALDEAIEAFETEHGADEVYFLGQRFAAPRFWGNQILLSAAGLGCLTNL